jgi:hypothetical protein
MTVIGEDVPKVCASCKESYWEDCCCGEVAYCNDLNKSCTEAIKECTKICLMKCCDCVRHGE